MLFTIIGMVFSWIIFEEYGEAGWYSLIPVYRSYKLFTIACSPIFFWLFLLSMVGAAFTSAMGELVLCIPCMIGMFVFWTLPLFAIFINTTEFKVKISAMGVFVFEVVLGGIEIVSMLL